MRAPDFEIRHQTLLHQLIVGVAALTYLADRDDVVWRFVKNSAAPHTLERGAFIVATLFVAAGAVMCTLARNPGSVDEAAQERQRWLGDFCYSIGLASFLPVTGFIILVCGEGLRVFRLLRRLNGVAQSHLTAKEPNPAWGRAFRRGAVKWGILVTMIVFVITLRDRDADVLAGSGERAAVTLTRVAGYRRSPRGRQRRPIIRSNTHAPDQTVTQPRLLQ
jgi:hypothetical protein